MAVTMRALLIEPLLESRTRMKEALRELGCSTIAVQSLEEAGTLLEKDDTIDLILISQRLDSLATSRFIERAKRVFISRDAA